MNPRFSVVVLALLIAAGACFADNNVPSGGTLDRFSYSQYGFDLLLPRGAMRYVSPVPSGAADVADAYNCGGLGVAVMIPKLDQKDSLNIDVDRLAGQTGLGRTSFRSPQGVDFTGASGVLVLTQDMISGAPPSLQLKPGMRAKMCVYAARLPSDRLRALVLVFVGPSDKSSEVDSLVQTVLNSIDFSGLKRSDSRPAAGAAAPDAPNQGLALSPGQIALKGSVKTISAESKSLTMLADSVTAYGQTPVALNPARQKVINYSQLPAGVSVGSRILVIGPNSGTGKPMRADAVVLEK